MFFTTQRSTLSRLNLILSAGLILASEPTVLLLHLEKELVCVRAWSMLSSVLYCQDVTNTFESFANAEMYIALATLFLQFDLELFETYRERDIDYVRDCFLAEASRESQGIRVKVVANNNKYIS